MSNMKNGARYAPRNMVRQLHANLLRRNFA